MKTSPIKSFPPENPAGNAYKEGSSDKQTTPMMAQYLSIKKENPNSLLFYRMGDFYELFFEDAVKASSALDIALTKRGKLSGVDVPMCGVPVHSHDVYLSKLIKKGFKVAICEQTEHPSEAKKRGSKAVVNREVMRIITPGTITEDSLLDPKKNNYLLSLSNKHLELGLAWIDLSTGDFLTQRLASPFLQSALARIEPSEILVPMDFTNNPQMVSNLNPWRNCLSTVPQRAFNTRRATNQLRSFFDVNNGSLFSDFSNAEISAAGALLEYLELTQKGLLPSINSINKFNQKTVVEIDHATRRNLELVTTFSGEKRGSLLYTIDKTLTGLGARTLANRLAAPLRDTNQINDRLDFIEYFIKNSSERKATRNLLRHCPDLERALSRLTLQRGGPRDLGVVRAGLNTCADILSVFEKSAVPKILLSEMLPLRGLDKLRTLLEKALEHDLPFHLRDGNFIAKGYSKELDKLKNTKNHSRQLISELQNSYVEQTKIKSLKIRHNNFLGYFIEVTERNADVLISDFPRDFEHRQTMKNTVRFGSNQLRKLEIDIFQATNRTNELEFSLFESLTSKVVESIKPLSDIAKKIGSFDVASSLAELSLSNNYCRPVVDDSTAFKIIRGRHPVVEGIVTLDNIEEKSEMFISNDCILESKNRLWLVTGPNMAGKSTFLRQNALIAILAQMGSFVPAESAHIGQIDCMFSRVGAADDLARGRSTFMVEMVETAAILTKATDRSFVILDEIGRGTATFDGLSIAWSVIEYLHETNKCRGLFATHYHELTVLSNQLKGLACYTMKIKEWKNEIVFLHEVVSGAADKSYGIHVGKLAGLPPSVISRAKEILTSLEETDLTDYAKNFLEDLPLFSERSKSEKSSQQSQLEMTILDIIPDNLSPREALDLLYELKNLVKSSVEK